MKDYIIKDYKNFLEENEMEDNNENMNTYISGLYYDLYDNIDVDRENFRVPKELDNLGVIKYIEQEIEKYIKEYRQEKINKRRNNMSKITLTKRQKRQIKEAYMGDCIWFDTIETILKESDLENKEEIQRLIYCLYRMNFIVIETEEEKYASKYNEKAQELYSQMKIDLSEMLGVEDMWEEL